MINNRYKGMIFDIQKSSVHDGPGIRTVVFLKGCPLRCIWCHNPESLHAKPEILFDPEKCVSCGRCIKTCPNECHTLINGKHEFDRSKCTPLGNCTKACLNDALELCGRQMFATEVIREVLKDKLFYENSGGGMTLSGGEPMVQFTFTKELLQLAKQNKLHVCMETCGFAPWREYEEILPLIDLFLFDIKTVNPQKHKTLTGQDNTLILENLKKLNDSGAKIFLRCPLVPGVNDSEAELCGIGELADGLINVEEVDVEPYHPLGISKAHRLGIDDGFKAPFTPKEIWQSWIRQISKNTNKIVKKQ